MLRLIKTLCLALLAFNAAASDVQRRTANDGQLLMEDIPEIPASLPAVLGRYQDIHTTRLVGWTRDSKHILVKTQNGEVIQLHRVDEPGGPRRQLTFGDEPVGEVLLQPGSNTVALTLDNGGDEFDQLYLLDSDDGSMDRLSDGRGLNNRMAFDRQGRHLAVEPQNVGEAERHRDGDGVHESFERPEPMDGHKRMLLMGATKSSAVRAPWSAGRCRGDRERSP